MRAPRKIRALLALVVGLALAGAGASPALADSRPDEPETPAVAALDAAGSGVDDFEFALFDAVYELSRGGDGRSQLRTTETLVAVFPDIDQNRGIRRALVSNYKGHSTSLTVESVTDGSGTPRSFEQSLEDEFVILTIAVPPGQYVHGEQTYVITYTQTDVTATSTDLADGVTADEFYWDTNGTGWAQPFREVRAAVRVDAGIRSALIGQPRCYWGYEGSTDTCEITGTGSEFRASVTDLAPRQNVTVALRFEQGTFAGAPIWQYVPIWALIAAALMIFGLVFALITRFILWRDAPGRGIIIAQYEPAEGVSALLAANIVDKPKRGMAATIVDLAVRKNLRILEHDRGWSKTFGVQKLSNAGLGPDEQRIMGALFSINPFSLGGVLPGIMNLAGAGGVMPQPQPTPEQGEVRWLTKGDRALGQQVVALTKAIERETEAGGLRRKPSRVPLVIVVASMIAAAALLFFPTFASGDNGTAVMIGVIGVNIVPWVAILAVGALLKRRPLTSRGSELKEHLLGLREYIRLAEADRLQMLQSVTGAERINVGDDKAIVKIYERLLPYAVLFGMEREWAQEIGKYYDTTPPDWYSGSGTFAIASFASGISSLSSNVSTSYSGSSGSSSSGGGGGGGSSGGGGGGGGGGGV